jgi:hypothetical protein
VGSSAAGPSRSGGSGGPTAGTSASASRDPAGPGIIETSLVLGLAFLLAVGILVFFGGAVADVIGLVVDAAHQGR